MNIFVLTGAGVSAESGLSTFRDKDGLWARFDPMKIATPEGLQTVFLEPDGTSRNGAEGGALNLTA